MPEKTKPDLFNNTLVQLEEILAELEFSDNLNQSLTDFELDIINREFGLDLVSLKKLLGLNIIVPPKN
jgi:hypothetical protein